MTMTLTKTTPLSEEATIFSLVYVSAARHLLRRDELLLLLNDCRKRNAQIGVTGMLLYSEGTFMQVLEGPEQTVRALYRSIEADPRHSALIVMAEEKRHGRLFGGWPMRYCGEWESEFGVTGSCQEARDLPLAPSRAHTLLRSFHSQHMGGIPRAA